MITIVGIDPGFSGALAYLDPGSGSLRIEDMPVAPNQKGRTEMDLYHLGELLVPSGDGRHLALLEFVAARPGQGAPATFRFGQSYGAIQMALTGHGWEQHSTTPAQWKKHFGLTDKSLTQSQKKQQSLALARQRFPDYADLFKRVKDDGRAEAALIALYAKEKLL